MAATLVDRYALANNVTFQQRCTAGVFVAANVIGIETSPEPSDRASRRVELLIRALTAPEAVGVWFARAASGWNPVSPVTDLADIYADTVGTADQKVAAITDTQIVNYIAGAWNVLAGVQPWERN